MAVWDCFMFWQELDLLELRLNELRDVVDHFVLVESPFTHSGKEKPLYYWRERERFRDFPIVHIVFTEQVSHPSPEAMVFGGDRALEWTRENLQRDAIIQGLAEADDEDVILVSDADEIPSAKGVSEAAHLLRNERAPALMFDQRLFYYYMDLWAAYETLSGLCTRAILHRNLRQLGGPQALRRTYSSIHVVKEGGWHFSWLGGVEKIQEKFESFAHQELNQATLKDPSFIEACLHTGRTIHSMKPLTRVPIDETYPKYLRDNLDRFRHLVSPEGLPRVTGP